MLYFNRNGAWFTIPINKDAVYDRDLLEKQIHTSLLGLQNLKDRSPGLDQMRFEKPGEYLITSKFGRDDILIYPPSIVPQKGRKMPFSRRRILLGIEYTDGTLGTPISSWYGPTGYDTTGYSYIGSGVSVGSISGGGFTPEFDIKWTQTADLLSPTKKTTYTFPSPYTGLRRILNSQMQGEAGSTIYTMKESGFEKSKVELTPLVEQVYDGSATFDLKKTVIAHGTAVYPDWTDGVSAHWWTEYISQIEVNGVVIAGPFTYIEDNYTQWSQPSPTIRWQWKTFTGESVYELSRDYVVYGARPSGVLVNSNIYFCLYSKITSNALSFQTYTPSLPADERWINSYSGNFTHEIKANCSGVEHDITQKTMDWTGYPRYSGQLGQPTPFLAKCTRIFAEGENETNPNALVYTFSYWEPQYLDLETGYPNPNLPPVCQYGMIEAGQVSVTTKGFPGIGNYDDSDPDYPFTEWPLDLNIVQGIPEGFNSSILTRAYIEKTTGERVLNQ